MSDRERLQRLVSLLYGLAAVMFVGLFLELLAAKHVQEPMQLVPVVICVAGCSSVLLAWKRPSRNVIQGMRLVMLLASAVSLLGIWQHVAGNLGFVLELHPNTTGMALALGAIAGRAPVLASGALAATGVIAILASFAAGRNVRGMVTR